MAVIGIALVAAILIFGGLLAFVRLIPVMVVGLVILLSSILYHRYLTAPACDSDVVTLKVADEMLTYLPNGALKFEEVRTLQGGLFAFRRSCSAEIQSSFSSTGGDKGWTHVIYSVIKNGIGADPIVRSKID